MRKAVLWELFISLHPTHCNELQRPLQKVHGAKSVSLPIYNGHINMRVHDFQVWPILYPAYIAGPNSVAGPDALAQIFEASRRGSDTLPGANYPSQGFQKPFGGLPAAAFDPATAPSPRSLDPWGAVAPREGGPMQQLDGGDHIGFASPPFFSGHTSMRYQGY